MLALLKHWLSDPPPATIFEIAETGVTLARLTPKSRLPEKLVFAPLPEGIVESSPIRQNIHNVEAFEAALQELLQQTGPIRKKDAALLLPDNCARTAVLDFENLPGDPGERLSLIRWRLKKAVPFDVDTASVAYQVQRANATGKQFSVLVAVSPVEVVSQYEAAVRKLGNITGFEPECLQLSQAEWTRKFPDSQDRGGFLEIFNVLERGDKTRRSRSHSRDANYRHFMLPLRIQNPGLRFSAFHCAPLIGSKQRKAL